MTERIGNTCEFNIDMESFIKCANALHVFPFRKNGSCPDFHLEIYYNRSTGVLSTVAQRKADHDVTVADDGRILVCEVHEKTKARELKMDLWAFMRIARIINDATDPKH